MPPAQQGDAGGLHRSIKYRPDIDGLRAIAVTSVVAFHVGLPWVKGGFVGVDIFFVISGFLIGALVFKEIRNRSFSIAKFYERRAKRILPALCGVLVFSYVAASLLLSSSEMSRFAESALATVTSTSNIYFCWRTGGYFFPDTSLSPLLMTWSLGVEEQFYILFPMLMLLLCKTRWRLQFLTIGSLATLSLAACIWGTFHAHTNIAFYMLPMRAWELGAGVLLAIFEAQGPHPKRTLPAPAAHVIGVLGLMLIGISVFAFNGSTRFPGYAALIPVCGAVLIIAARSGIANRLLSLKPVVFIGLVSYSWYLWHWPMLSFARITVDGAISPSVGATIGLLSLDCAVLSYKYIEQPFRKSTIPTPKLLARYAALIFVMMLPAFAFRLTNGLPQRNKAAHRLEVASQSLSLDPCLVQEPDSNPELKAPCLPSGTEPAVALVGDSHAAMLASALRPISQHSGYRLIELTKGYCPPLDGVAPTNPSYQKFQTHCLQFNTEILHYVIHDPKIQVVVIAWLWSIANYPEEVGQDTLGSRSELEAAPEAPGPRLFEHGLDKELSEMERAGKAIYLVRDVPQLDFDPSKLLLNRLIGPRRVLADLIDAKSMRYPAGVAPRLPSPQYEEFDAIIGRIVAAHPNVHLVDLRGALCNSAGCRFSQGNQTLFMDRNHLSPLGAQVALAGFRFPYD